MALSTEAAAVNTAVDSLLAAWQTYIQSLTYGSDKIMVVPSTRHGTSAETNDTNWFEDDDANLNKDIFIPKNRRVIVLPFSTGATDPIPATFNGMPAFWKVTNSAGDMT